mmetsp:Transcript_47689/g.91085  ORF Transcript_47689/g.91085 Transcript_47689/m.91085 type:complete len:764 (-) Transcript_47689:705-2996(-)
MRVHVQRCQPQRRLLHSHAPAGCAHLQRAAGRHVQTKHRLVSLDGPAVVGNVEAVLPKRLEHERNRVQPLAVWHHGNVYGHVVRAVDNHLQFVRVLLRERRLALELIHGLDGENCGHAECRRGGHTAHEIRGGCVRGLGRYHAGPSGYLLVIKGQHGGVRAAGRRGREEEMVVAVVGVGDGGHYHHARAVVFEHCQVPRVASQFALPAARGAGREREHAHVANLHHEHVVSVHVKVQGISGVIVRRVHHHRSDALHHCHLPAGKHLLVRRALEGDVHLVLVKRGGRALRVVLHKVVVHQRRAHLEVENLPVKVRRQVKLRLRLKEHRVGPVYGGHVQHNAVDVKDQRGRPALGNIRHSDVRPLVREHLAAPRLVLRVARSCRGGARRAVPALAVRLDKHSKAQALAVQADVHPQAVQLRRHQSLEPLGGVRVHPHGDGDVVGHHEPRRHLKHHRGPGLRGALRERHVQRVRVGVKERQHLAGLERALVEQHLVHHARVRLSVLHRAVQPAQHPELVHGLHDGHVHQAEDGRLGVVHHVHAVDKHVKLFAESRVILHVRKLAVHDARHLPTSEHGGAAQLQEAGEDSLDFPPQALLQEHRDAHGDVAVLHRLERRKRNLRAFHLRVNHHRCPSHFVAVLCLQHGWVLQLVLPIHVGVVLENRVRLARRRRAHLHCLEREAQTQALGVIRRRGLVRVHGAQGGQALLRRSQQEARVAPRHRQLVQAAVLQPGCCYRDAVQRVVARWVPEWHLLLPNLEREPARAR